jgi:proteasome lid subunit RPN8/RPN11
VDFVRVTQAALNAMIAEARLDPSIECCGFLAGSENQITAVLPAPNVHAAPSIAYEIAPEQLFQLFREIRAQGHDLLGIYHSHPSGENAPSPADIERAYYPDAAYFITSPHLNAKNPVRAFHIRNARAEELTIEVIRENV